MSDLSEADINLLRAAKEGDINEVKHLISEGADVNAYDTYQGNSLYWAVKNNHPDTAKVLLDNGADFITYDSSRERHVQDQFQNIKDEHCKSSLHLAARLGNLEAVEDLLGQGANVENDKGETPLHSAAASGHKGVVQTLLDKGANVNAEDNNGKTPLDLTTNEEIRTLLQNTAELFEADDLDTVKSLLEKGANVNAKDPGGMTPLHLAARDGKKDVVEFLLQNKANVNAEESFYRMTSLHWAAKSGHTDIVNALINAKADVNAEAFMNMTPLLFAAKNGHEDVVEILLNREANVNAEESFYGMTSLHWAAQEGHEGVVKMLLTAKEIDVNTYSQVFNFAAQEGHEGVVKMLLTTEKIDVAVKDDYGKTLLHWAAKNGNVEEVRHLIIRGASVNTVDKNGSTPLDLTTDEEIKTLLKDAKEPDDVNLVGGTSPNNEGESKVSEDNPQETEEQPSSFFGSLFSILTKPFSLVISFFSGFFSWLFESNTDESISQTDARCEGESSSCDYDTMKTDE